MQKNNFENFDTDFEVNVKVLLDRLKRKLWYLILFCLLSLILGYGVIIFTPKTYTSKIAFVVEEGKPSMSGVASIAGQFGLDVGLNSGTSLISGENLLLFLKSTSLTRQTLLTEFDSSKKYSLADKYADVYGLRKKWFNNKRIRTNVYFASQSNKPFDRLQDSLLNVIVAKVLKKELSVERPEKKASFVFVSATMQDEVLSKLYCERLVQKAVERFISLKTKRQRTNVDRLQYRADSIARYLYNKTYINAEQQEKVLDINPAARSTTVAVEVSTRDKAMIAAIYGEIIKNLELAKMQLNQETPTIQIVDEVNSPLICNKPNTLKILAVFLFFGLIIGTILLGFKQIMKLFFS